VRFLRPGSSFARLRVPLRLGKDAIDLPEPLAALVQGSRSPSHPARHGDCRTPASGCSQDVAQDARSTPSRHRRPATPARLGAPPHAVRNRALLHLAEHLPAAVFADLLVVHRPAANRWSTADRGRWMTCASDCQPPVTGRRP